MSNVLTDLPLKKTGKKSGKEYFEFTPEGEKEIQFISVDESMSSDWNDILEITVGFKEHTNRTNEKGDLVPCPAWKQYLVTGYTTFTRDIKVMEHQIAKTKAKKEYKIASDELQKMN